MVILLLYKMYIFILFFVKMTDSIEFDFLSDSNEDSDKLTWIKKDLSQLNVSVITNTEDDMETYFEVDGNINTFFSNKSNISNAITLFEKESGLDWVEQADLNSKLDKFFGYYLKYKSNLWNPNNLNKEKWFYNKLKTYSAEEKKLIKFFGEKVLWKTSVTDCQNCIYYHGWGWKAKDDMWRLMLMVDFMTDYYDLLELDDNLTIQNIFNSIKWWNLLNFDDFLYTYSKLKLNGRWFIKDESKEQVLELLWKVIKIENADTAKSDLETNVDDLVNDDFEKRKDKFEFYVDSENYELALKMILESWKVINDEDLLKEYIDKLNWWDKNELKGVVDSYRSSVRYDKEHIKNLIWWSVDTSNDWWTDTGWDQIEVLKYGEYTIEFGSWSASWWDEYIDINIYDKDWNNLKKTDLKKYFTIFVKKQDEIVANLLDDKILSCDLKWNQITEIPKEIWNLTNLEMLSLDWNQITEIPKEIWNLTKLSLLDLEWNQITEIPKEIWNLTNLEWLCLRWNKLTEIPKEIWNFTNLKWLYLEWNKLTEIPKEIWNLTNLKWLNLEWNQITEIPKEIWNLTNLEVLYLYWNKLTEIPQEIWNLTNLRGLNLEWNKLTKLPNLSNVKYEIDLLNETLLDLISLLKNSTDFNDWHNVTVSLSGSIGVDNISDLWYIADKNVEDCYNKNIPIDWLYLNWWNVNIKVKWGWFFELVDKDGKSILTFWKDKLTKSFIVGLIENLNYILKDPDKKYKWKWNEKNDLKHDGWFYAEWKNIYFETDGWRSDRNVWFNGWYDSGSIGQIVYYLNTFDRWKNK